jgi:hypothetical protein
VKASEQVVDALQDFRNHTSEPYDRHELDALQGFLGKKEDENRVSDQRELVAALYDWNRRYYSRSASPKEEKGETEENG